jgi:hypothetical protein
MPRLSSNQHVGAAADIYALGLILNEAFTGETPVGTEYKTIVSVAEPFGFLDDVVAAMIRQSSTSRTESIFEVKKQIGRAREEIAHKQKISMIDASIVLENTVDDPLAIHPPVITDVKWDAGRLAITFDQDISEGWIAGLHNMRSFSSVVGLMPKQFHFVKNQAFAQCPGEQAQTIIMYFKDWLPQATLMARTILEDKYRQQEEQARQLLRGEKAREEERFRINNSLRF